MKLLTSLLPLSLLCFVSPLIASPADHSGATNNPCSTLARIGFESMRLEFREDLLIELGNCINLTEGTELSDCFRDAFDAYSEGLHEARSVYDARLKLCGMIGEEKHNPVVDPANFVAGISNPLLPFEVGRTWTYELEEDGETEVIVISVLSDTRTILGVECTIVRDTVTVDGELLEDTFDWYAQDKDGNVWYFGEISINYVDGELNNLDGSWEAGVGGATPGIVMFADPVVGTTYRQEFFFGDAEDVATIISTTEEVTIGLGSFSDCVQTEDFTPLDPSVSEYKYYAPGVGLVLEVDPTSGAMLELVSMTP